MKIVALAHEWQLHLIYIEQRKNDDFDTIEKNSMDNTQ